MIFHQQLLRRGAIAVLSDLDDLVVSGIATPDLLLDLVMTLLEGIRRGIVGITEQLTMQMRFIQPQMNAKAVGRVIRQLKIDIVVSQCCSRTERDRTIHIRKNIKSVAPSLRDRERAVPCNPEQQISQLAKPPSRTTGNRSLLQDQTIEIPLSSGGTPDQFPHRQCFAGPHHHLIDPGDSQLQIPALVVLKLKIHTPEWTEDQRLMPEFRVRGDQGIQPTCPGLSPDEPYGLSSCDMKFPTQQLPNPAALNGPRNFKHALASARSGRWR